MFSENLEENRIKVSLAGAFMALKRSSKFTFHLTGSRSFFPAHSMGKVVGGSTNEFINRDWDFFVESNQEVEKFLVGVGFELHMESNIYIDANTFKVFRFNRGSGIPEDWIDVQLVKSVEAKIAVQRAIRNSIIPSVIKVNGIKRDWSSIWDAMTNLYFTGKSDGQN